jgi:hypothetical protein
MKTIEWLARLDAAKTPQQVSSVIHDYVSCWSSYDRAQLPESCRLAAPPSSRELGRIEKSIAAELDRFDLDRTRERLLKVLDIFVARGRARIAHLEALEAGIEGLLPGGASFAFMKPGTTLPLRGEA